MSGEAEAIAAAAEAAASAMPVYVTATDVGWLWNILAGILILLMHLGFALLEGGSVRHKSVANIFFKNLVNVAISAIAWFALGYAFTGLDATGDNPFIGGFADPAHGFFNVNFDYFAAWFFQFTFCATTATIVSGAVAERTKLEAYMAFAFISSAFIYPVVVHWAWDDEGWLYQMGYADFAGSGVIHVVGGFTGLIAAIFVGPRTGRFQTGFLNSCLKHDHQLLEGEQPVTRSMDGHSVPFQVMGTIVLFVGWLGFNPGSTGAVAGEMNTAALCAVNTVLGAAGGLAMMLIVGRCSSGHYDVGLACNGMLAGLVAVTAGCNTLFPPIALGVGILGALAYYAASRAIEALEIDDPLDAFPVHGGAGCVGVLVLAFLPQYTPDGLVYSPEQILPQVAGLAAIIAWTVIWAVVVFGGLHLCGFLRTSKLAEEVGLDEHDHKTNAYYFDMLDEGVALKASDLSVFGVAPKDPKVLSSNSDDVDQHTHIELAEA